MSIQKWDAPSFQTTKLSPFERRLMREVEIREQETGPRPGPTSDQVHTLFYLTSTTCA